jgi:prolyl 4-hydroxylase
MTVTIIVCLIIIFILLIPRYQEPYVIRNVFSSDVCDHIIKLAEPRLTPSEADEGGIIDVKTRKSETAWLNSSDSHTVERLIDKCTSFTDRQPINCEKLQVLKYKPGGFYRPHQDAFPLKKQPNPRLYTCMVALNDGYTGGETIFPNLRKDFKLNKGDVLIFNTLNDYGYHTKKALHGGSPVNSGDKWVCNLWIHRHPYTE